MMYEAPVMSPNRYPTSPPPCRRQRPSRRYRGIREIAFTCSPVSNVPQHALPVNLTWTPFSVHSKPQCLRPLPLAQETPNLRKFSLTSTSSGDTNCPPEDHVRSRASSLVEELLTDIYARWDRRPSFTHSFSLDSDNGSTTSDSFGFMQMASKEVVSKTPPTRQLFAENVAKSKLVAKRKEDIKSILKNLQASLQQVGSVLLRELKRRGRLVHRRDSHYNVITAILQAASEKRSQDMRMRFSVEPFPGDSGFGQWHDAMRMVARLPGGIPAEFRKRLWLMLAERYLQARGVDWPKVERVGFNEWSNPDDDELGVQIVKDLHRTGCSLFCGQDAEPNQALLKRVLLAYARWNKTVGYCQGFNMLAALILQVMERSETDALKVMIFLIEGVLPESYFANNMRGLSIDMAVFRDLLRLRLPELSRHLEQLQHEAGDSSSGTSYEPPLTNVFTMQWFLTLFCNCLPQDAVLRVWDLIFVEGNEVLLRAALAIWDVLADRIMTVESADEFYSIMGVLTREMLEFGLMDANNLVKTIVNIAEFPFPELADLRDKYTYNITPWTHTVSVAAKKGLRLFYSDDDEDDQDDDEKIALATAYGVSTVFRSPRRRDSLRGAVSNQMQTLSKDRLNLDIAALKQQYSKLRERQKQAHIILSSACVREKPSWSPATTASSGTPIAMNHLLLGKRALLSKGRRAGTAPVPMAVIPGGRGRGAIVGARGRGVAGGAVMVQGLGRRTGRVAPLPTLPAALVLSPGPDCIKVQVKTKPAKLPKSQTTPPPLPSTPPAPPESGETLHWKDEKQRRKFSVVDSGSGESTRRSSVESQKDSDDDDDSSSTSTELCDDEGDRLSDFDSEDASVCEVTTSKDVSILERVPEESPISSSVIASSVIAPSAEEETTTENPVTFLVEEADDTEKKVEVKSETESFSPSPPAPSPQRSPALSTPPPMRTPSILLTPDNSSPSLSPQPTMLYDEMSKSADSLMTITSPSPSVVDLFSSSRSDGDLFFATLDDIPDGPEVTTLNNHQSPPMTPQHPPDMANSPKRLSQSDPDDEKERKFYERLTNDICRREFTLLEQKSELKDSTSDSDLVSTASSREAFRESGRRNSERALQIIQENSKILERILSHSAKAERRHFYWSESSDGSSSGSSTTTSLASSPSPPLIPDKKDEIGTSGRSFDEFISSQREESQPSPPASVVHSSTSSSTLKEGSSDSSPTKSKSFSNLIQSDVNTTTELPSPDFSKFQTGISYDIAQHMLASSPKAEGKSLATAVSNSPYATLLPPDLSAVVRSPDAATIVSSDLSAVGGSPGATTIVSPDLSGVVRSPEDTTIVSLDLSAMVESAGAATVVSPELPAVIRRPEDTIAPKSLEDTILASPDSTTAIKRYGAAMLSLEDITSQGTTSPEMTISPVTIPNMSMVSPVVSPDISTVDLKSPETTSSKSPDSEAKLSSTPDFIRSFMMRVKSTPSPDDSESLQNESPSPDFIPKPQPPLTLPLERISPSGQNSIPTTPSENRHLTPSPDLRPQFQLTPTPDDSFMCRNFAVTPDSPLKLKPDSIPTTPVTRTRRSSSSSSDGSSYRTHPKKSPSPSFNLPSPSKPIFNPFPNRQATRQPKDLGIKLGLYSPVKLSPQDDTTTK